jgi:hypothetical protein
MKTSVGVSVARVVCLFVSVLALAALPVAAAAQEHSGSILLVYGAGKYKRGDNRICTRLLKAGYTVTALADDVVTSTDAEGKNLVILSDSVSDARLGDTFRSVPVPILCSEPYQLDNLGMTVPAQGTDYGKADPRRKMTIKDPSHSLAAGLQGSVMVNHLPFPMGWGTPGESAQLIATLGRPSRAGHQESPSSRFAYFAYDPGAAMPGLSAPAMRIAIFLSSSTWSSLTPAGLKLFDAAVDHGVRSATGGCIPCQTGEHQVTLTNGSAQTIWVGVWDKVHNRGVPPAASCFKDWELAATTSKTYCAPFGANLRFFPRGGCKNADGSWKAMCDSNDCNSPPPASATCGNGGLQSLAEINFDNEPVLKDGAYYDVSYVDGYTNPVTVTIDNSDGCKTLKAGCDSSLGACPWPTRDSAGNLGGTVCWGACKEIWARRYKDNLPEAQRPTDAQIRAVCCQCQAPYGCGDAGCNDVGCGCSPHAAYPASYSARTCCSPIPDLEAPYITQCAPDHCTWPAPYPAYARQVKVACDVSYSWQFHDDVGLMHCTAGAQPYNFTVTFWPK